jgi:peptide deformylase
MDELQLVAPELIEDCICEPIQENEVQEMIELGKRMIEFCVIKGSVGVSCPQLGIFKKMFVFRKTEDSFQIVINPTFYPISKKPIKVLEGCMSYPDKSYLVERFREIQATFYLWERGLFIKRGYTLTGNKSIIFQHENLHVGKFGTDNLGKTIKQYGVPQIDQLPDPKE